MRYRPLPSLLWLLPILLTGCKVGPNYQPPQVQHGPGWSQPAAAPAGAADLDAWWRALGDPTLDRLVASGLAKNLDVRQAQVRIREARSLRESVAGALAPAIGAHAGVTRMEQSMNGQLPLAQIPIIKRDLTLHDVGFDMSWELDVFGRTRRAVESAEARAQAQEELAHGVQVSVAAEIARTYLTMRGAQRELAARTALVAALSRSLETVRLRVQAGDLAPVDAERAEGQYLDARAALPALQAQMHAAALGLGVLLGQLPESEAGLTRTAAPEPALAPFPVGERADLLRRRPDVQAAERLLAGATADIGLAKAEWFPRFTLSASGGYVAQQTGQLFQRSSQTFSVAPFISWRILDGGTIKAQIHAAEARQEEAALAYEQTVLTALSDGERACSNYRLALEATEAQRAALDFARRAYHHAELRYQQGDIALGELLDAERVLREAEDGFARVQTGAAIDLVALCKALGGGWRQTAPARKS